MNKNIFLPRINILPYEYPQLLAYKDAIRHSYWIDTEFNFTEDIQDFKITINSKERDVIKKTMLAIAQIEVNVKTFWLSCLLKSVISPIILTSSKAYSLVDQNLAPTPLTLNSNSLLSLNKLFFNFIGSIFKLLISYS